MHISILDPFHSETVIKKSRFLVDLIPAQTENQAREALAAIKKRERDATHHCSAFRLGTVQIREQSNDDGEPAGTAGRPMLTVLQHRDVTDILAVVTRYFGGIKLGAGGLVRAYGGSLAEALRQAPLVRFIPHIRHSVIIPYDLIGAVENAWQDQPYRVTAREFAAEVTWTVDVPADLVAVFTADLIELSAARIRIVSGEKLDIPIPLSAEAK